MKGDAFNLITGLCELLRAAVGQARVESRQDTGFVVVADRNDERKAKGFDVGCVQLSERLALGIGQGV